MYEPGDSLPDGDGQSERVRSTLVAMDDLLAAWRAAERRLLGLDPSHADWGAAQADVDRLRQQYDAQFRAAEERAEAVAGMLAEGQT